jgi:hypothetical protein
MGEGNENSRLRGAVSLAGLRKESATSRRRLYSQMVFGGEE